jgi:hypothetical protein
MNNRALVLASVFAACTITAAAAADRPMMKPMGPPPPKPIPANYIAVSPCVPGMGAHYVNPKAPFDSPIYGTYQGKPVFTEIMMTPKELAAGKSWRDVLKPLPGYTIDHVDIEYEPHGHPGMTFAHYDVHAYYIAHAVHVKFCPGSMHM